MFRSNGRIIKRRYEDHPSEDPAFEKSYKNAIVTQKNREKNKTLMDIMRQRCDKLTSVNDQLESDNEKLRHHVKSLDN